MAIAHDSGLTNSVWNDDFSCLKSGLNDRLTQEAGNEPALINMNRFTQAECHLENVVPLLYQRKKELRILLVTP